MLCRQRARKLLRQSSEIDLEFQSQGALRFHGEQPKGPYPSRLLHLSIAYFTRAYFTRAYFTRAYFTRTWPVAIGFELSVPSKLR